MIYHGDLFDVLPTLDAESIDACVTDPPYGIGFMGKQWDTFKPGEGEKRMKPRAEIVSDNPNLKNRKRVPASSPSAVAYDRSLAGQRQFQTWTEEWAREVWRVLKPGAHLLVCGAPRSYHRMASGLEDAGFEVRDCVCWLTSQGFPKSKNLGGGWGSALKPSFEPVVVARKPFGGSLVANFQRHGTGGMNIDACRIEPSVNEPDSGAMFYRNRGQKMPANKQNYFGGKDGTVKAVPINGGRWPANVAMDEDSALLLDTATQDRIHSAGHVRKGSDNPQRTIYDASAYHVPHDTGLMHRFGDTGGASRFFYVAKPSRSEREEGIYEGRNGHPTVKPIELMRWLVKLVTPPGGIVLDPFCGSGTTGMACAYELRPFIGIERESEYVEIAKRRIAASVPLFNQSGDRSS